MKKQISNSRLSSIPHFYAIVKENHKKLVRLDKQVKTLQNNLSKSKNEELKFKISVQEGEIAKATFVIIIFSVIIIESYMYDYAARNLGDTFVKDHLDKLDTLSKCIVIPELVTGQALNRNQTWFVSLKKLIGIRNKITHYKTQDTSLKNIKKSTSASNEVKEIALQSISLLQILADKISEIDPEETPWVQSFLS